MGNAQTASHYLEKLLMTSYGILALPMPSANQRVSFNHVATKQNGHEIQLANEVMSMQHLVSPVKCNTDSNIQPCDIRDVPFVFRSVSNNKVIYFVTMTDRHENIVIFINRSVWCKKWQIAIMADGERFERQQ